jgi:hypothetical protein
MNSISKNDKIFTLQKKYRIRIIAGNSHYYTLVE